MKHDQPDDRPPVHPAIKRFREGAARKVAAAQRKDRVDMEAVLAAFDAEQARHQLGGSLFRQWLGSLFKPGPRLAWTGAAVIILALVIWAVFPLRPTQVETIRLTAFVSRGSPGETNAGVFAEGFRIELNMISKTIRVIDGLSACTGTLVEQPRDKDILSFKFEAHGTNVAGAAIAITNGVIKLLLRENKQALASVDDLKEGIISGEITEGNRPLRTLQQRLSISRKE